MLYKFTTNDGVVSMDFPGCTSHLGAVVYYPCKAGETDTITPQIIRGLCLLRKHACHRDLLLRLNERMNGFLFAKKPNLWYHKLSLLF